jgi:hypothetical protein
MKKSKQNIIYISLLLLAGITTGLYFLIGFPIAVLPYSKPQKTTNWNVCKPGSLVEPLKNMDFSQGKCAAYILISRDDFKDLSKAIKKKKVLFTKSAFLLKRMQDAFKFNYTGGDIATVESVLYIFNKDKLVFESPIIIDEESVGLQSREYGWIEAKNGKKIISVIQKFEVYNYPLLLL